MNKNECKCRQGQGEDTCPVHTKKKKDGNYWFEKNEKHPCCGEENQDEE